MRAWCICRMLGAALAILICVDTGWTQVPSTTAIYDTLTLEAVIGDVVRHNDKIAAARYLKEAADKRAKAVNGWEDPMLMLGLVNVPTSFKFDADPMTMKTIGLSQTIPYAGQSGLTRKSAQAEADAALQEQYGTETDVIMAARIAYADLYYRTKAMSDLAVLYDVLDDVTSAARSKLTTNQGTQAEVLAAQAERWRMTPELYDLEHMAEESQFALNTLRGRQPGTTIPPLKEPDGIEFPQSPDAWIQAANQNYPPLQKLTHESNAYALSGSANRRMNWPSLSLSAEYGFRNGYAVDHTGNYTAFDDMMTFQATLSLPIFSRKQNNQMAASMEAMRNTSNAEATQMKRDVEAKLRSLHLMIFHLQESITLFIDNVLPADEDAYKSALAGYTTNKISMAELLTYVSAIYKDKLTLNQFENQLARAVAEVRSYTDDPKQFTQISANQ